MKNKIPGWLIGIGAVVVVLTFPLWLPWVGGALFVLGIPTLIYLGFKELVEKFDSKRS